MKSILLPFLIITGAIACRNPDLVKLSREGQPDIYSVTYEDETMNTAIRSARETLSIFDKALLSNKYDTGTFALKIQVESKNGHEHIWVTNIQVKDGQYFGTVSNQPEATTKVKLGQNIALNRDHITDWMFSDMGILRGGYTIKAIRDQMTKEEQLEFDADFPLKIED